jgi:hypothetical protein
MSDTDTPQFDGLYVTYRGRTMLRVVGGDGTEEPPKETEPGKGDDPKAPAENAEAEKWKALARKHEKQAKENADAARELAALKEGEKTDLQKATDTAAEAEKRAVEAEKKVARLTVALRKGLTETQSKRLIGDTEEDLEKDADELLADFKGEETDGDEAETEPGKGERKEPRRRPKERLKPGSTPSSEPEETDPAALAEAVPRRW